MSNNSNKILQMLGGFIAFGFALLEGIDWLFTKYEIDSFYFNLILVLLLLVFIISIFFNIKKTRKLNKSGSVTGSPSKIKLLLISLLSLTLIGVFVYFFKKINDNENLINEKIPQIIKLFDQNQINLAFLETKKLI